MRVHRLLLVVAALYAAPIALDAQTPRARSDSASSPPTADSLSAATRHTRSAEYRSPRTATVLAVLLVGGGHFYSDEAGRGALLLGISAAGTAVAVRAFAHCWNAADACERDDRVMIAGAAVGWAAYLTGILDAHDAAHRHNRSAGLEPPARRVGVLVAPGAGGAGARVGVSVALGR